MKLMLTIALSLAPSAFGQYVSTDFPMCADSVQRAQSDRRYSAERIVNQQTTTKGALIAGLGTALAEAFASRQDAKILNACYVLANGELKIISQEHYYRFMNEMARTNVDMYRAGTERLRTEGDIAIGLQSQTARDLVDMKNAGIQVNGTQYAVQQAQNMQLQSVNWGINNGGVQTVMSAPVSADPWGTSAQAQPQQRQAATIAPDSSRPGIRVGKGGNQSH